MFKVEIHDDNLTRYPSKSELNGMEFQNRDNDPQTRGMRQMQTRDGCIFEQDLKIVYEIVMMSTA